MSKVKIQGNASGTGTLLIAAPDTDETRTINLPDSNGTILDENSSLPAANLTGTVADARFPAILPAASGANLTSLPAANLTGTIADARLPDPLPALDGSNLTGLSSTTNSKFLAYPTAAANNNVTGTGTSYSWSSDAHTLANNEGSAMGTSAGSAYYTAPETGWYIFTGQVFWYGHSTGTTTQWIFYLITTPKAYQLQRRNSNIPSGFSGESWSVVCKMSSGDTAFPRFIGYGTGAPVMDFWGGGTSYNWWSGALLA
jgi:hypothetical protein